MSASSLHLLVLAAGNSTRLRTGHPKALLDLCGRPLLSYILSHAEPLQVASKTVVLGGNHIQAITSWLQGSEYSDWSIALQENPRGTGHAVQCALEQLPDEGRVLILCGDTPLLRPETLQELVKHGDALMTARVADPSGYGRIQRDDDGNLTAIIEDADTDEETRLINEMNAGVYVLDLAALRAAVAKLDSDNAQGELYLTDAALEVLTERGGATLCLEDGEEEIAGVNTLVDFSEVVAVMRWQILEAHLLAGVIIDDPSSTWVEHDVSIGPGTRIRPGSVLHAGVRVGKDCELGPYVRLRAGAVIEDGALAGNFVEMKNSTLGAGAKAKHLTYLGNTTVEEFANVGCGTITANYDGKKKHPTVIGSRASIGSGTILVAPVKIGAGATTAAGSVVTAGKDVPAGTVVAGIPAKPFSPKS
ncbi:MAG: NTP transferase domain-containing protein [Planctomycetes bacterium]|jgi:bifunctional UDP-N-acetylglucosamine pyrophosphorylase / glucosamine-1-phosphate N-acetyltransferase|nr:NTP transferase domain-containing protein [Planctomycetota bacterium]MBT4028855.1 NTP transferase domain-containing protein [Planctomycetota bacterium]MBT4559585.1 NTP transferase domain-containing protein [Planctomycetota bacterium]MBT5100303.1 NTP transferase domain-containing protein [Planctomycetota bacterium]MBT5120616.1 NTP transferase domain-containing protein [Planctomycetota bacterium]